jgi:hypothetical protein
MLVITRGYVVHPVSFIHKCPKNVKPSRKNPSAGGNIGGFTAVLWDPTSMDKGNNMR